LLHLGNSHQLAIVVSPRTMSDSVSDFYPFMSDLRGKMTRFRHKTPLIGSGDDGSEVGPLPGIKWAVRSQPRLEADAGRVRPAQVLPRPRRGGGQAREPVAGTALGASLQAVGA